MSDTKRISHWIDGRVVEGTPGRAGDVFDPATGQVQGRVDLGSSEEVDRAVASALAAFPAWRATSLSRRAEVLFHLRELVDANRKEIATILNQEHGKVLRIGSRRRRGLLLRQRVSGGTDGQHHGPQQADPDGTAHCVAHGSYSANGHAIQVSGLRFDHRQRPQASQTTSFRAVASRSEGAPPPVRPVPGARML